MECCTKSLQMLLHLILISLCLVLGEAALPTCSKIDDCSCRTPDGKSIVISSLGNKGGTSPRFDYELAGDGWMYAYNPCYTFTDTASCQDVVACQKSTDGSDRYPIGDGTATWWDDGTHYTIQYSSFGSDGVYRTSTVTLVCDSSQETPTLDRIGVSGDTYFGFTLTSKCCCPGVCDGSSTPTASPPSGGGISPGSVLCILVSVLIIVYAVGGLLFMKYVRNAEGREIIPNYEAWTGLFGYIRDGFVFVFSCGKKSGYGSM